MTLSVLVVGPALVRDGLGAILAQEDDFAVVTEAGHDFSERPAPDVIVGCVTTLDEVRVLKTHWPEAQVLVAADLSLTDVRVLNEIGVLGLLPLTAEPDELIWAVRNVARGKLTLHPSVLRALVAHLAASEAAVSPLPPVPMTARERDVLRCLVLGASDKDIAQQLYLSVRTVQSHLTRLYSKLGVHSRTEAALAAVRAGWFAEEPAERANDFSNSTEGETRRPALVAPRRE